MKDLEREFAKLKKQYEDAKRELAKLEGQERAMKQAMEEDFDIHSLEEAEEHLKEIEELLSDYEIELEANIKKLKEELSDGNN